MSFKDEVSNWKRQVWKLDGVGDGLPCLSGGHLKTRYARLLSETVRVRLGKNRGTHCCSIRQYMNLQMRSPLGS